VRFHDQIYENLIERLGLARALGARLPEGVTAVVRGSFVFVLGFNRSNVTVKLGAGAFRDVLSGKLVRGKVALPRYGVAVLQRVAKPQAAAGKAVRRGRRVPNRSPARVR
jgi:beta-galactosidase